MSYIALYRKFRPSTFDEVRGQDHIVATLRNQIRADRIGHAYLFVGTRGTGKTTVAKIFARAVNCESPVDGSPCGNCAVCRAIEEGASLNVVELDAASHNGVDDVRGIIDEIDYSPTVGRFRVYIVDEVHMFSTAAFNALLKTLEEPPAHVIFILATTEAAKIPVTILSRCQRYDFHRISLEEIRGRLEEVVRAEGIAATEDALSYIARAADGALRDALSLLDQCAAFHYGEELTRDMVLDVLGAVEVEVYGALFDTLLAGDIGAALDCIARAVEDGRDLAQYVSDFIWYLRNLLLILTAGDGSHLADVSTGDRAAMERAAARADLDTLLRFIRVFSDVSAQIRYSAQKRILLETAVIRLLRPQTEDGGGDLVARVAALEDRAERGEKGLKDALGKLERGAYVAPAREARADAAGGDRENRLRALAKALPEEVRRVAENRGEVARRLPSGPLPSWWNGADLSVDEDGTLVVVSRGLFEQVKLDRGNDREGGASNAPGTHEEEIMGAIRDYIGKEVKLRVEDEEVYQKGGGISVDEILKRFDLGDGEVSFGVEEDPGTRA